MKHGKKKSKPPKVKLTDEQKELSRKANYNYLDLRKGKRMSKDLADMQAAEKNEWFQAYRAVEREVQKILNEKLESQGVTIHKKLKLGREWLEIQVGDDGKRKITGREAAKPQLRDSPMNLKGWRQHHRLLRQQFMNFLLRHVNVRIFTVPYGPVKLDENLRKAIQTFHNRIANLASSRWAKSRQLDFLLRKTELPPQNVGEVGKEQVFLHAHLVVESGKWLGTKEWEIVMKTIRDRAGCKFSVDDAGPMQDEEKASNYLFKNPLIGHTETGDQTYDGLARLTPEATKVLYEALHAQRMVSPMGAFKGYLADQEKIARQKEEKLKTEQTGVPTGIRSKVIRAAKRGKHTTPIPPNTVLKVIPGRTGKYKALVAEVADESEIMKKVDSVIDSTQRLSSVTNSGRKSGVLRVTAWMLGQVTDYLRRLGEKEFRTVEVQIMVPSGLKEIRGRMATIYDPAIVNLHLEAIPWVKSVGKGRGKWRRWRVKPRHSDFPGFAKVEPNFTPDHLPKPGQPFFVNIPRKTLFAPGYWRVRREAQRRLKRRS